MKPASAARIVDLPGSRWTEERDHLARADGQVQVMDDGPIPVGDRDAARLDREALPAHRPARGPSARSVHGRRLATSASGTASTPIIPTSRTASAAETVGSPSCCAFRTTTDRVAVRGPYSKDDIVSS